MMADEPLMNTSPAEEEARSRTRNVALVSAAIVVALLVVAGVAVGIFFILESDSNSNNNDDNDATKPLFSFDDIFNPDFVPTRFSCLWIEDGRCVTELYDAGQTMLLAYEPQAGTAEQGPTFQQQPFLAADQFPQDAEVWIVSPNAQYVLFGFNVQNLYRHSYYAQYSVFVLSTNASFPVTLTNDIRMIQWSPDSSSLVYVQNNNVFYCTVDANGLGTPLAVTTDGLWNFVINGAPDWLYEEEILGSNSALWWAPDSAHFAFIKFHESQVDEYSFPVYGTEQYPTNFVYKYPCPGTNNSIVSLWVFQVSDLSLVQVDTSSWDSRDHYISQVAWVNGTHVAYRLLDRLQQFQELWFAQATTGASNFVVNTTTSTWLEPNDYLYFFHDQPYFIDGITETNARLGLFSHQGQFVSYLSPSGADVQQVYGFNVATNTLFMSVSVPSTERHIFSTVVNFSGTQSTFTQLTTTGGYYRASFDYAADYGILYYDGPSFPTSSLVQTSNFASTLLVNNPTLEAAYNARSMPTKTYTDVPSAVDGTTLNAMFIYPPGFNAKAATKYPVLMHVYGGPNSQQVSKRMESPSHLGFHMFLAASMNVIVVIADNRGTCCRGDAFLKSTYLELGIIETQDQLAVADYLASLSYVDAAHIGLWGWSYGGFMASRVITAASKSIAMTMAVAPVTKWDYYDSAYTERFMQTPATNAAGYNVTSVLPRASAILPSARFLLIHGTADDNVHLQHSTVFSTQLVTNGVSYDTMYYTDKNHAISGTDTRKHLYKKMADFVASAFGLPSPNINIRPAASASAHKRELSHEHQHKHKVVGYHWRKTMRGSNRAARERGL